MAQLSELKNTVYGITIWVT